MWPRQTRETAESDAPSWTALASAVPEAREALARVLDEVVSRRSRGEQISDEQVIAGHPELMPDLGRRLLLLSRVHKAFLAARRAGPIDEHLEVLSDAELEAPIPLGEAGVIETPRGLPSIEGYRLIEEISSGGQATVYKAVHEATGRTVAVKVMSGGPFLGSRHRIRARREAHILASLSHPSIVGILDQGRTADGSFFLAMDYVEGGALDAHLEAAPGTGLAEVLNLIALVCEAVDEAHAHGVVHRDLKPSNILVDRRGQPHVLDFGLARPADEAERFRTVTHSGQFIGSLPWASPEQASGGPRGVDARSDVYALGVMLYQALTGVFPYSTQGELRVALENIQNARPRAPRELAGSRYRTDAVLDGIVLKSLAKSPEDRYASAGALGRDLRFYLAGQPTAASTSRPAWRGRRTLVVALVACALALSAWPVGQFLLAGRSRSGEPGSPVLGSLGPSLLASAPPEIEPPRPVPSLFTNSLGMRFVPIAPGEFDMGSPPEEFGRRDLNVERLHRRKIERGYLLAVTEVTQRQFEQVMGFNPTSPEMHGEDNPVERVDWYMAADFCRRLSEDEGRTYRLPTEAEWEYACRAGTRGPYAGNGKLPEMGWFGGNSEKNAHPVATKLPNAWGLYDMHGGVGEWCAGKHAEYPDENGIPAIVTDFHVTRGGGRDSEFTECRSAHRRVMMPNVSSPAIGFRVLLDVDPDMPAGAAPGVR